MFLKELTNKEIFTSQSSKGFCRGVGISLKSHAVKYLLCASSKSSNADFAISTSAIERIEESIHLSKLRPLFPRNCARICIGRPVYTFDGAYLGKVADLEIENHTATRLRTDKNNTYPVSAITACLDAVILKREQPYPLGQCIPAPLQGEFSKQNSPLVTKQILKDAIAQERLIKLTLSLPPFQVNY